MSNVKKPKSAKSKTGTNKTAKAGAAALAALDTLPKHTTTDALREERRKLHQEVSTLSAHITTTADATAFLKAFAALHNFDNKNANQLANIKSDDEIPTNIDEDQLLLMDAFTKVDPKIKWADFANTHAIIDGQVVDLVQTVDEEEKKEEEGEEEEKDEGLQIEDEQEEEGKEEGEAEEGGEEEENSDEEEEPENEEPEPEPEKPKSNKGDPPVPKKNISDVLNAYSVVRDNPLNGTKVIKNNSYEDTKRKKQTARKQAEDDAQVAGKNTGNNGGGKSAKPKSRTPCPTCNKYHKGTCKKDGTTINDVAAKMVAQFLAAHKVAAGEEVRICYESDGSVTLRKIPASGFRLF